MDFPKIHESEYRFCLIILHKLQMFMVSRLLRKTKALPIWQTMIRKSQISNN